jgi:magnesium-protoporphyrin O-methyltransferase
MDCCNVYADQFDRESALSQAQRYRKRGLEGTARVLFDALVARDVAGARVVDFGGGVGTIGLELVKSGAASSVNVELSASYREASQALALEAGLEDRVHMTVGDAADPAGQMNEADIVVMNRVICCYPDGDRLMNAAIAGATRMLAFSYPSIHPGSRAVIGLENWLRARRGSEFRAFVHPQSTMVRPADAGFREIFRRRRPVWSVRVWESIPSGPGERDRHSVS